MTESTAPQARRGEIAGWPKLVITYPTEPGRIANLLPPGLEPTGDDTVQIGIYCVPINSEPEYGVSIKVPASWQGVEGQYNLGMGIDQEAAVHISAERNGQPKFLCHIDYFRLGTLVGARARALPRKTRRPSDSACRADSVLVSIKTQGCPVVCSINEATRLPNKCAPMISQPTRS